jgi:phage-related minor tail protein
LALAKANTAANIKFSGDTALLTPGDAAIAQTLKGQYNSVAESLDTAEAAQIRFNKSLKDVSTSFQTDAGNAFLDFETGAKSGGAAMADFEKQFTRSILNMVNQMIILAPIAKAFQGLLTGGIDLTSFGFNPIKGVTGSAHGNIFDGSNIIPFAHGGIVDDPTLFKFANGTGLMGEAGPEAIVPLKRGADGNLGIASQGGSSGNTVIVNTYPTENSQVETRTSRNSNGQTVIDLIHSTVDQKMGSGGYDKTLAARYGVRPQARSR